GGDQRQQVLVAIARERNENAFDPQPVDEAQKFVRPAEHGTVQLRVNLPGLAVDEAEQADAVFGVIEELAREQLTDVPCTHYDGVLRVAGPAAESLSRQGTTEQNRTRGADP